MTEKQVMIFGAGEAGKLLARNLQEKGLKVKSYLVSEGYRKELFVNAIPVEEYNLESGLISCRKVEAQTVYMTTKQNKKNIKSSLERYGYLVVDVSEDENFAKIYEDYYKKVFIRNSLNGIENDTIQFEEFEILNPMKQSLDYQLALYLEMADLLRPAIKDDDGDYEEGPYEIKGEVELEKGDIVFDCGSNIGLFAMNAAAKGCTVYAFEPVEKNRIYLVFAKAQFPENIIVVEQALGDYSGYAYFDITGTGTGCHIVEKTETAAQVGEIEVPITSVDEFVRTNKIEKVDFIKADIEGAERNMLAGAQNTMKLMKPKLAICTYHFPDDKEVLEKLIWKGNENYQILHKYKKLYAYVENN